MNVSNAEQAAKKEDKLSTYLESEAVAAEFAERVRSNQAKLSSDLKPWYQFIVCGSGWRASGKNSEGKA